MKKINKKMIILTLLFIITIINNLIYLIGTFPGNLTPDSVNQLTQIVTSSYSNAHTPLSTLFYKIPYELFGNIEGMIFFQQIFFAIVSIYGLSVLLKYSKYKIIPIIMYVLFILFPTNGFMLTNMWKDIPYSISIMLLTVIVLQIFNDTNWLKKKRNIILFTFSIILVSLLRHNGIIVGLITLISLFVFNKNTKNNILVCIITIIAYVVTSFSLNGLFNVSNSQSKADIISIPLQQIAAVVSENGILEKEDKDIIEKIAPLETWKEKYNPYLSDNIKNITNDYLKKNVDITRADIIKTYINVVKNNFIIVSKAYLKQISIIWRLDDYPKGALTYYSTEENILKAEKEILNPNISDFYKDTLASSKNNKVGTLICWNPALIMYIVLALILIYVVKNKSAKILFLLVPMMSNILSLMISIPAQDYRYLYPTTLASFIIVTFIIDKFLLKNEKN